MQTKQGRGHRKNINELVIEKVIEIAARNRGASSAKILEKLQEYKDLGEIPKLRAVYNIISKNQDRINQLRNDYDNQLFNINYFVNHYPEYADSESIDHILETMGADVKMPLEPVVFTNRTCKWIIRLYKAVERVFDLIPPKDKEEHELKKHDVLYYIATKYSWLESLDNDFNTSSLDNALMQIKDFESLFAFTWAWNQIYQQKPVKIDKIMNGIYFNKDGETK